MSRHQARVRRRVQVGIATWWDAVTSGAFFSRTTALLTLLASVTVLGPFQHYPAEGDHVGILLVALLSWGLLLLAVTPAALAERRLRSRTARGILVLATVLVAAAARPFLNEAVWMLLTDAAPAGEYPGRITTNIFVLFAVCSVAAVTARSVELGELTRARLADAVRALDEGRSRVDRFDEDNRRLLEALVADLRDRRDALLDGPVDFTAVRRYSDDVRRVSHRLEDRSHLNLQLVVGGADATRVATADESGFARLSPPPRGLVGILFSIGAAPYVIGAVGWALTGVMVLSVMIVAAAADIASRRIGGMRSSTSRGVAIAAVWCVAGVFATVVGHVLLPDRGPFTSLPLITMPAVAIVCGLCAHALDRAVTDGRRLEAVLASVARSLAAEAARARQPLRQAAHILHGRVQGRCVLLAAAADEDEAELADRENFRRDTDEAFDAVLAILDGREAPAVEEDLDELLTTWSAVLDIRSDIAASVAGALDDRAISTRVATIVNEGFVNAVKHSVATAVNLTIDLVPGTDTLRVRTWSTGVLKATPDSGRGIHGLGEHARIYQDGESVVLEVLVPRADAGVVAPPTEPVAVITRGRAPMGSDVRAGLFARSVRAS